MDPDFLASARIGGSVRPMRIGGLMACAWAMAWLACGCSATSPRYAAPAQFAPQTALSHQSARSTGRIATASWYGSEFSGRRTSSGEVFDPNQLTAASRSLPMGSRVRVTNVANGRSVVVRINDRGPFVKGRGIDLSHAAARRIGLVHRGVGRVAITRPASTFAQPNDSLERVSYSEPQPASRPRPRRRHGHGGRTAGRNVILFPLRSWMNSALSYF